MSRRLAVATLLVLSLPVVGRPAQPQFWRIEGAADFLAGTLEDLAVDSEGGLRLAGAKSLLHDTEAPAVWALARDAKGVLYAGTGNDGKVFRIEGGKASVFFDASELEIHALAIGPDGRLYAGSSPDGKVYAIDAAGKAEEFFNPGERYIWALLFDDQGRLFVATGADATVQRVDKSGKGEVVFKSPETHILSLARDTKGNVYAGSAPGGVLYRIDTGLRVFALHDSPFREVKAIEVSDDGSVYAALVDGGKEADASERPAPALPVPATPAFPEGFSSEGVTVVAVAPASPATPAPRASEPGAAGAAKGAVIRIAPDGEVDTLWSSQLDTPHSLLRDVGGVLLGTGDGGKLFRIRNDRTWSMLGVFAGQQVTALVGQGRDGAYSVATSNAGKLYAVSPTLAARGTFVSAVRDTATVSTWGRIAWLSRVPAGTEVQLETRSGNTTTPDSTWGAWSAPYKQPGGQPIASESARFLQLRVTLVAKGSTTPVVDSIETAYLQRNLRPQVQSVTVHPAGEIFQKPLTTGGEIEILGLDAGLPPEMRPLGAATRRAPNVSPTAYGRRLFLRGIQTFTWKAEDPNGDALRYDVHYRALGEERYRLLRGGLDEPVVAWDTTTVPNGRYVVRVTASDAPGNPESLALTGQKESTPFDVDNTPPTVSLSLLPGGRRVRAAVADDSSQIRRVEFSVNGGSWQEIHPIDGINDSPNETYEITPSLPAEPGPHLLVVRATDLLGNVATARLEVPPGR